MIEENKDLLKFNAEGFDPTYIWHEAKNKAVKAVDEFVEKHGEPMYCGFASVSIHPAKGKFVDFLKRQEIGDKGYRGGYRISYYDIMPLSHQYRMPQSLDIKEVATEAFRDELRKYGMTVYADSRAD